MLNYDGVDAEWKVDVGGSAIPDLLRQYVQTSGQRDSSLHEFEFTIWRDEADRAV